MMLVLFCGYQRFQIFNLINIPGGIDVGLKYFVATSSKELIDNCAFFMSLHVLKLLNRDKRKQKKVPKNQTKKPS